MADRTHSPASLLRPISLETFFSTYWERGMLLVQRGDEGYYEGLLTNRELEEIISTVDARYPAIRLAKDGSYYPAHAYCDDVDVGQVTFSGVPNIQNIFAEYSKGATIALTSLDRSWRPLGALCMQWEGQLHHPVNTNVYITAGHTAGFPPHYDTHDILVLQIGGMKRWRIYEPTIKLPHVSQPCEPKIFTPGPRLTDIELHAGDLLYLPRGYGHAATTSESYSAHITIGINVYTWADLVADVDPSCVEMEKFRKALPAGFASRAELRPAMRDQLKRIAPGHFTDSNLDQYLDGIARAILQSRRRHPRPFRSDVIVVSAQSQLKVPPAHRYELIKHRDGLANAEFLTLDFDGNMYRLPAQMNSVLEAMCSCGSFRVKDLPDCSNGETVISFASFLQEIGFLTSVRAFAN